MDRMTTDNEKHGLFFLNTFYGKDGQVWVRGGGPAPGYEDCTLVDFMSRAATPLGLSLDEEDPETVGEIMYDNLQFGPMECEGVLGFLWLAAGQATEMRGRLKMIEDILGDNYNLDRLREIVKADREKRCAILKKPMKPLVYKSVGSDVYCPNCDEDLSGGWELAEPDDERRMFQCPRCGQSIDVTTAEPSREIDSDFIRMRFERIV